MTPGLSAEGLIGLWQRGEVVIAVEVVVEIAVAEEVDSVIIVEVDVEAVWVAAEVQENPEKEIGPVTGKAK